MDYTPSRYVRQTLLPEESCVKDARFSWAYTTDAWLLWAICATLGYMAQRFFGQNLGPYYWYPLYAGVAFGGWLFFLMMLKKWTTEILLTDRRLIYKRGFLVVKVEEVDIEQLASDNVEQSLWGRIFDYGVVHVRCIEADDIILPAIDKPYEFRNALEQQKHLFREHYMRTERLRRRGSEKEDK